MSNLSYLNNIIDNHYQTYETMKRKYGIIKEVINESKAVVTLEDKDMSEWQKEYKRREEERKEAEERGEDPPVYNNDGTRDLILPNATGESLVVGDSVWVHYWHDLASGYIAIVNRLSKDSVGKINFFVDKLAVLDSEQGSIYAHARRYNSSSQWDTPYENQKWQENYDERTMNIDEENDLVIAQGEYEHGYNIIFVNGMPVLVNLNNVNLANPDIFGNTVLVKTRLEVSKWSFTKNGVSREYRYLNPSVDSEIFVSPIHIASVQGDSNTMVKSYRFGCIIRQGDLEDYFVSGSTYSTIQEGMSDQRVLLALNSPNSIFQPTTMFPYGYINANVIPFSVSSMQRRGLLGATRAANAGLICGFRNIEEYEYAKCVVSTCDYEIIEQ